MNCESEAGWSCSSNESYALHDLDDLDDLYPPDHDELLITSNLLIPSSKIGQKVGLMRFRYLLS